MQGPVRGASTHSFHAPHRPTYDDGMNMTELPEELTPTIMAASLRGFAEGAQALAKMIETGQAPDATKEQRTAGENAARAILRNGRDAVRMIRRLEGSAQEVVTAAEHHRDEIMTSMFGPDVSE